MNKLKKLDKIELVLFKILDIKLCGLFPSLIRFFPMFNFINNDANIVIIIDIDDQKSNIINIFNNIKKVLNKKILNKIYLIKIGNLSKNILYNYHLKYNFYNIYSIAQSIINIKKIDYNIIINFINKIKNTNKMYTYYKYYKYDNDNEYNIKFIQSKPFIYGIDEYFINYVLTKYLIDNKLLIINNIKWNLFGNCYYIIKRNYLILTESNIKILNQIFFLILNKINYKYDKNIKFIDLFNIIDNLIYIKKNINVIKIIYKIFLVNYKKLNFILSKDTINILLNPKYKDVYKFEKIIFNDSKYKDIIIKSNKII